MSRVSALCAAVLMMALCVPRASDACEGGFQDAYKNVKHLEVPQLAKLRASKKSRAVVLDLNPQSIRERFGIVPGAKLLSSETFELSELPAKKKTPLIFYCINPRCEVSWKAAERARLAGYKDVGVFSPGIVGWQLEGHPTEKIEPKY